MNPDEHLQRARNRVTGAALGPNRLEVKAFFDEATFTASPVAHDPETRRAANIDRACDFDQPAGLTTCASAHGFALRLPVDNNGMLQQRILRRELPFKLVGCHDRSGLKQRGQAIAPGPAPYCP
jgi:hypothetical protein